MEGPCDDNTSGPVMRDPLHEEAEALRKWCKEHPMEDDDFHEVELTEEQIKYLRENGSGELLDNYFKRLAHYKRLKRFERWYNQYAAAGCLTCGCFIPSLIIFILVIVGAWRMIFGG